LYNWYAATDSRKLCPTGWHVPTDSDWNKLVKFIDSGADTSYTTSNQSTTAGGKMKSTSTLWNTATPPRPGTDNFGFTALPGGYRSSCGGFDRVRGQAFFWSATEFNSSGAWYRLLKNAYRDVDRLETNKSVGASVRCLRD
jgi:uncharacterized protein (TIGR02145 family)